MSILFTHFFQKINEISPLEADFTEMLSTIAVMPKILYFYGNLPQNVVKTGSNITPNRPKNHSISTQNGLKNIKQNTTPKSPGISQNPPTSRPKTVAIVGSRHNTRYGEEVAYHLAYTLAKRGVIIVSGLAFGIDSIGHRGCLDAGGTTVAVLGTAIDHIYPRSHLPLAREIIEKNGAIISEYAPGSAPITKFSFLHRNRIIAGLSDVVVVVEAAEHSGSLNTAMHALEQGKEVYAVPGNITSPYSQGCNKLIQQGAFPYTEPNDILKTLFPEDFTKTTQKGRKSAPVGTNDVETAILQALDSGLRSGEEIMEARHLSPEAFNRAVTMLEISGRIRALGMNHWSLT